MMSTADSELMVEPAPLSDGDDTHCQLLRANTPGMPRRPVVFFDGSLVASFAGRLPDDIRAAYLTATVAMLAASRTRSPADRLCGYQLRP